MATRILLPIPASVSATLVVAAPERPLLAEVAARLRDAMPDGVELRLTEVDGRDPSLAQTISQLRCPHCSPDVDPLVAVLLERTSGHLAVTCAAAPGWPPVHLHSCAEAVERVAELTGGMLLDTERATLLAAPWRPRMSASPEVFPLGDWVGVDVCLDDDGRYSVDTTGLSRFGLPELRVNRLQEHHIHGWLHLTYGLAGVLVRRVFKDARLRGRGGVHMLPVQISVSTTDVAAALASPSAGSACPVSAEGPVRSAGSGSAVSAPVKSAPVKAGGAEPRRKIPQGRVTVRLRHNAPRRRLHVLPPQGLSINEAGWRDRAAVVMCEGDDAR